MSRKRAFYLSLGFAFAMLLALLAGADKPPPPGFILLVLVLAGLVALGTFVIPTWWATYEARGLARTILIASGEGAGLGLGLAIVFSLLPGGDPTAIPTFADLLVWLAVVTGTGAVVGAIVGAIAVAFRPRSTVSHRSESE